MQAYARHRFFNNDNWNYMTNDDADRLINNYVPVEIKYM